MTRSIARVATATLCLLLGTCAFGAFEPPKYDLPTPDELREPDESGYILAQFSPALRGKWGRFRAVLMQRREDGKTKKVTRDDGLIFLPAAWASPLAGDSPFYGGKPGNRRFTRILFRKIPAGQYTLHTIRFQYEAGGYGQKFADDLSALPNNGFEVGPGQVAYVGSFHYGWAGEERVYRKVSDTLPATIDLLNTTVAGLGDAVTQHVVKTAFASSS